MKILLAYGSYLPLVGGVWTYVNQLRRGLEERGHYVEVLAHHPNLDGYYLMKKGEFFETGHIEKGIYTDLKQFFFKLGIPRVEDWIIRKEAVRYCFEISAFNLDLTQYDIIHAQDVLTARALSRVKPQNTPLICTINSSLLKEIFLSDMEENPVIHKTLRFRYVSELEHLGPNSCDMNILPSQWLKDEMSHYSIHSDLTVIPYGIDIGDFQIKQKSDPNIAPPSGKKVIACAARLVYEKGQLILLEALKELKETREDWVCWIIGDQYIWDNFREILETKTKNLNLQNDVLFLGNRQDVPSLLRKADIFVLPSLLENLPFAIIEAQIAGKPIISTDAGGIPEMIVHGKTGLLSPVNDSKQLFQNLKMVLEDVSLRENLAFNAKVFGLKAWSHEKMVDQTLDLYYKLLDRKCELTPFTTDMNIGGLNQSDILKKYSCTTPAGYQIPDPAIPIALMQGNNEYER